MLELEDWGILLFQLQGTQGPISTIIDKLSHHRAYDSNSLLFIPLFIQPVFIEPFLCVRASLKQARHLISLIPHKSLERVIRSSEYTALV